MLRALQVLALLSAVAATCASQTIPDKLLSSPVRLELDKPTQEVKEGTMVTYTVTLKNAKEQPVTTSNNLQLGIETPTGAKNIEIPAGQSSATFTWRAANPGVMQMTVRSGKLVPATGLLLVTPSPHTGKFSATAANTGAATTGGSYGWFKRCCEKEGQERRCTVPYYGKHSQGSNGGGPNSSTSNEDSSLYSARAGLR